MKRRLILPSALVLLALLGAPALAASLPSNGTVTVTGDGGTVIGTGTIANGHLSLQLQTGASGFVTISVTGGAAGSSSFSAMIDRSGDVTVVDNSQFQDLGSFAKANGLTDVTVSQSPDAGGSTDHASETGQDAKSTDAAEPSQETENSQAGDHSQGNGTVSGTREPGDSQAGASGNDSETPDKAGSDSNSGTSSADDASGSGDDSVNVGTSVGTNVGTNVGSGSTSTSSSSGDD